MGVNMAWERCYIIHNLKPCSSWIVQSASIEMMPHGQPHTTQKLDKSRMTPKMDFTALLL